jgi:hypothetical protein
MAPNPRSSAISNMTDLVTSLIEISGSTDALAGFSAAHLESGSFDFNTVHRMPPELQIESSSAVETGYAALYGDWQLEAGRWMFKEPAQQFGFPFPLESREQVIKCLQSFDCADMYLLPARTYHENVLRHGHGDWYGWCTEHWGTKWNADDVRIAQAHERVALSFVTAGSYPKPILKKLSLSFPGLAFRVRCYEEHCRWARDFVLSKGRETQKQKRPAREIANEVEAFRAGVA